MTFSQDLASPSLSLSLNNDSDASITCINTLSIIADDRLNQAKEYIKILTGKPETLCTFGCYEDKKELNLSPKTLYGTISEHFEALDRLNKQGYGIFIVVQETSSKNRKTVDIGRTRALFVDSDKQGLPEAFHLDPSLIVESSPGKHHIYWVLNEPVKISDATFKSYVIPLIKHYKADETCKDLARVLRLPGFFHKKGEPFLTRIISSSDKKYSLDEIKIEKPELPLLKLKNESKPKEVTKPTESLSALPETVETVIDPRYIARIHDECSKTFKYIEGLKAGKRHNTLVKKAYYLGGILAEYDDLREEYREKFHDLISSLEESGKWDKRKESHDAIDSGFDKGAQKPIKLELEEKLSKSNQFKKLLNAFLSEYGVLEWNSMALRLEIDREEVEANFVRQRFQEQFNFDVGKEGFNDVIVDLAKQNSYHPILEYLESLPSSDNPDSVLDKLFKIMGIENNPEIQRIQIKKWLIAAVARIYDPGCKVDNVLILKSPQQGIGKTSFFEALMGNYFQTSGEHKNLADEILAYMQAWCTEYGEIDCVFDKRSVEQMKAFLTKRWDTFRAPYASAPLTYKRSFLFCGTTNQQQFLPDATGNRRYWVVDVHGKIPIREIEALKDEIWSAAKTLYQAGIKGKKADGNIDYVDYLWYFDESEDELAKLNIADSEQIDAWEDEILNHLKLTRYATTRDIQKALELPTSKVTENRIANVIKKRNGDIKARDMVFNGIRARYWCYDDIEKLEQQFEAVKNQTNFTEQPDEQPLEPSQPVVKTEIDKRVDIARNIITNWKESNYLEAGKIISTLDKNEEQLIKDLCCNVPELSKHWKESIKAFEAWETEEILRDF